MNKKPWYIADTFLKFHKKVKRFCITQPVSLMSSPGGIGLRNHVVSTNIFTGGMTIHAAYLIDCHVYT